MNSKEFNASSHDSEPAAHTPGVVREKEESSALLFPDH